MWRRPSGERSRSSIGQIRLNSVMIMRPYASLISASFGTSTSSSTYPASRSAAAAISTAARASGWTPSPPGSATTATRIGRGSGGPSSGAGTTRGSRGSGPARARQATRRSATVRASTPSTGMSWDESEQVARADAAVAGEPPVARLERGHAAEERGDAHRSPRVVAEAQRRHARRERHPLAAARPARREARVPGVDGVAVELAAGVQADREVRHVGAPDRDRAGLAEPLHHGRIGGRHGVTQRGHAVRGRRARHVDVLLDRERHPGQGPEGLARGASAVGLPRRVTRGVGEDVGDRIDRGVHRRDPPEVGVHHLERADLSARRPPPRAPAHSASIIRVFMSLLSPGLGSRGRGVGGRIRRFETHGLPDQPREVPSDVLRPVADEPFEALLIPGEQGA